MASVLSKSQFFFMRNLSVLNTIKNTSIKNFTLASSSGRAASSISSSSSFSSSKSLSPSTISAGLLQRNFFSNDSFNAKRFSLRSFSTLSSLRNAAKAAEPDVAQQARKRTLLNSSKYVGYWLIGTSGLVFGIVVLGGITRLTESGLSITEWKPVTGAIPPLTHEEWEEEFAKYKESPEFKQLNSHITLEEFQWIFFFEWAHRLWGRAIGVVMLLPAAYFVAKRKTTPRVNRRIFVLLLLLGLQGAIGWWMVKSGLDEKHLEERRSKPTVSQYRLTTHLGAAFALYAGMIWTGFEILRENKWIKDPKKSMELFQQLENPALGPLRRIALGLVALTFITAMSGGLVAGLDAGLIYNTFPHMGDDYIPSQRELFDDNYARKEDKSDKFWRNMLENPTTVQLNHRILATTTFFTMLAVHMYANRIKFIIPKAAKKTLHSMMGVVSLQVSLGIFTLLYLVPIPLASAHQAGALALFTTSLIFAAQLRKPRTPIKILNASLYTQQLKKAQQAGSKILTEASKLAK